MKTWIGQHSVARRVRQDRSCNALNIRSAFSRCASPCWRAGDCCAGTSALSRFVMGTDPQRSRKRPRDAQRREGDPYRLRDSELEWRPRYYSAAHTAHRSGRCVSFSSTTITFMVVADYDRRRTKESAEDMIAAISERTGTGVPGALASHRHANVQYGFPERRWRVGNETTRSLLLRVAYPRHIGWWSRMTRLDNLARRPRCLADAGHRGRPQRELARQRKEPPMPRRRRKSQDRDKAQFRRNGGGLKMWLVEQHERDARLVARTRGDSANRAYEPTVTVRPATTPRQRERDTLRKCRLTCTRAPRHTRRPRRRVPASSRSGAARRLPSRTSPMCGRTRNELAAGGTVPTRRQLDASRHRLRQHLRANQITTDVRDFACPDARPIAYAATRSGHLCPRAANRFAGIEYPAHARHGRTRW